MKIAISTNGNFRLSRLAYAYLEIPMDNEGYPEFDLDRHDPRLIECINTLGDLAFEIGSTYAIMEIPDGVEYELDDYLHEVIHEKHRKWNGDGEILE